MYKKKVEVYYVQTINCCLYYEADINCFLRMQEGILDYFRRYLELLPSRFRDLESQSKGLDEVFLELIHNLRIMDEDFLSLIVEDPFFNRMTEISTLM